MQSSDTQRAKRKSNCRICHTRAAVLPTKSETERSSSTYPVPCIWRKSDVAQLALWLICLLPAFYPPSLCGLCRALTLCWEPEEKTVKILFRSLISKFVFGFSFLGQAGSLFGNVVSFSFQLRYGISVGLLIYSCLFGDVVKNDAKV